MISAFFIKVATSLNLVFWPGASIWTILVRSVPGLKKKIKISEIILKHDFSLWCLYSTISQYHHITITIVVTACHCHYHYYYITILPAISLCNIYILLFKAINISTITMYLHRAIRSVFIRETRNLLTSLYYYFYFEYIKI